MVNKLNIKKIFIINIGIFIFICKKRKDRMGNCTGTDYIIPVSNLTSFKREFLIPIAYSVDRKSNLVNKYGVNGYKSKE